jgi:hypothetical protein
MIYFLWLLMGGCSWCPVPGVELRQVRSGTVSGIRYQVSVVGNSNSTLCDAMRGGGVSHCFRFSGVLGWVGDDFCP